ncbi:potassium-transporting ATPase subunit KdpA [Lacrimispora saccharolytica]|uniref:Potassium-transporting ATPase potassium-binding subunit n=1 Tax=Lacrimispora saccharolytica (strain ATCC 35040 / DSM 2544 / NRCC 2533 / WM1) TaxID=610130 RepID=D9R2J7_LACSW|nr:potassium-transporting ATPase subunit KdpA [Lacrimispora saccharolytica]ADL06621.1 potassium-transporting ATPase, A subunit [[Clostridium] saccharolyticum WM1]QRV19307.1 potassium-transporting ATPase subunit KdpA [Lacrimispora saccharolytica]
MSVMVMQDLIYMAVLVGLSIPLGIYIYKVMTGQRVFLTPVLAPVERVIYKLMGTAAGEEMNAGKYAVSVLLFSGVGFVFLFLLLMLQGALPFNPERMKGTSWHLAFNTAASFTTNTNWQAYSGESDLSYFTQFTGLAVQNFVSAATGIAVLFALIRGLVLRQKKTIGNFWADLVRTTLYLLIPLSFVVALLLVSQGVVQTFGPYKDVTMLESGALQTIPLGPAASQIAIKQLGTNGGGFFGVNSAFPLENPTAFSNMVQSLSILLIPAALCVSFGGAVKDSRQGRSIYLTMLIFFGAALAATTASEQFAGPVFEQVAASGSMEGKEVIHGVGASSLWAVVTTAASNGSVNAMHDSLTPLGGMVPMFLMQLGEIVFGGVGSGLYGMLAFVLLTVFIAGLMVGRTPEYLGKKVEPFDMKMVCLIVLVPPLLTLLGTSAAVAVPEARSWLTNSGAHGFSEILYAFSSMANNNGSSFAGFQANTVFTNVLGGIIMLLVRFIPMTAVIFLAGNMAQKKAVAVSEGTLSTSNTVFVGLLIGVILIIGALSFLPALALGPIADFLTTQ